MPVGLIKGRDIPELRAAQSVHCDDEAGEKHNLPGVRLGAVATADREVAPL
jgi:hypothetical protein